MKKLLISILVLSVLICTQIGGTIALATNIDEITARQLGTYYLSVMTGKEAKPSQVTLAYQFMNHNLNIPAAYVFNVEDQGLVIVSGSDLWYPILGYSTEGLLDTNRMSPAFKFYIEGLCGYIIYSQNTGVQLITDIEHEWDELIYQKLPEVKSSKDNVWLMESKWGQGYNDTLTFNKFCPHKTVDSVELTAYAGCVAIAMAQIMYYWKYPVSPVKDTIGYDCTLDQEFYEHVNIDMSKVSYDYANMPIMLTSRSPERKVDATALLCYHAGVSVEMNYGISGSAAWSDKVTAAMRDVFLYDTTISWTPRTVANFDDYTEEILYTNDEWADILREEISAGRPMYYRGHSRSGSGRDAGGHAFVCDGVHSTNPNLFHFNWGWDGQPNIWCDVRNNSLKVNAFNFNFNQTAITHIQPRRNIIVTDIDSHEKNSIVSVYPNPATTQITISYDIVSNVSNIMIIYNTDGRLMDRIQLNASDNYITVDVSKYPKGLYLYKIGANVGKFVIR